MTSHWAIIVPEASTNSVLNPVAGLTTNVAAAGGATVTQSTTYAYFGGWSHRVQTAANNDGINITLGALANAIHYVTVRVRGTLPAAWDWSLDNATFTAPALLSIEGNWSVYGLQFPAAQANGSTTLRIYQNGAGAGDFYLGHIQVEQKEYATTPITGDRSGCEWNGAAHASTSTRDAQSRAGGRVRDLEDTYSVQVSIGVNIGVPSNKHHVTEQALLPGALFQGRKILPRAVDLILKFPGTGNENLHSLRSDLWDAIKPDLVKGDQPFRLRYTGANANKPAELVCTYDSGMEFNEPQPMGYGEQVSIRCLAYDPFFYAVHESATHLTTSQSIANADYAVRKENNSWANISTDFNLDVAVIAKGLDGCIYIGGYFTDVGDANGDCLVKWNPQTSALSSLGTGLNGGCEAIAIAPNGDIYVGGAFTLAGGVANTARIARWDGSAWNAVSTGIASGAVWALAFGQDGKLYVGGSFTDHGDANGDYITSWNGSAWASLGTGMNNRVNGLVIAPNGDLYASGYFTTAGGTTVNGIAKWNGSAWSALSTGISGGAAQAEALGVDVAGNIYVGGNFTAAGGVTVNYIGKWNGAIWSSLGGGTDGVVRDIFFGDNGLLYASGGFTAAGGLSLADHMAIWNGSTWAHVDINLPGVPGVYSIRSWDSDLYLGYDTSGTATSGYKNTLTNNGTAETYPKFIFKRSGGTSAVVEYIKNETTGATLWLNYALLSGETLTIDLSPGNRSIVSSFFGNVWRALLRNSDFADFYLLPGSNDVSVFVNAAGAPTMTAYALWTDAYWSADGAAP